MLISPAFLAIFFNMFAGGLMIAALGNYIPTYLKEAMHIDLVNVRLDFLVLIFIHFLLISCSRMVF